MKAKKSREQKIAEALKGNKNGVIHGRTAVSMAVRLNQTTADYIGGLPSRRDGATPRTIVLGNLYQDGLRAKANGAAWLTEPTTSAGRQRISVEDAYFDELAEMPADGNRAANVGRLIDLGYWWQLQRVAPAKKRRGAALVTDATGKQLKKGEL